MAGNRRQRSGAPSPRSSRDTRSTRGERAARTTSRSRQVRTGSMREARWSANMPRSSRSTRGQMGASGSGRRSNPAAGFHATRGGRASFEGGEPLGGRSPIHTPNAAPVKQRLDAVRIGDIRGSRAAVAQAAEQKAGILKVAIGIAVAAVVITIICVALYWSGLFPINNIEISGADHLTTSEVTTLAAVPEGETLVRVDTAAVESRLEKDAWVADAKVSRVFPGTLRIDITERKIAAVVQVPTTDGKATRNWLIASDDMWLMPIPDQNSELGKTINQKIYEDAEHALKIQNVPYGTEAKIGTYCTDSNVKNAIAVVDGLTTDMAQRVVTVSATDPESTTLILDTGVEIAFGTADNIREKERVCMKLMEEYGDTIAYINVRTVSRPTWRAI